MRLMHINKKNIWYATYEGLGEPILDENGFETGEREILYSTPEEFAMNVSVPEGTAWAAVFGTFADYDRVIVTDWIDCPVDENSIFWVDVTPDDGPHDYVVRRVAKYLNHIAYAVKKVDLSV